MTDVLGAVEHVTVTIAALVTAGVATWGVTAWRRQLKGQTEFEVARMALRAAYRVRDALSRMRNPFMSSGEQAAALVEVLPEPPSPAVGDQDPGILAQSAVYEVRWRAVATALSELDLARVESEALWGVSAVEAFADLRSCATELNAALTMHLRHQRQPSGAAANEFDEKMERIVFGFGEDDEYSDRVAAAIADLETFFRPRLK